MLSKRCKEVKKKVTALIITACIIVSGTGTVPVSAVAASRKVVKKLSVSRNYLELEEGETESVKYKVTASSGASKKINVLTNNSAIASVKVKNGKIKVKAKSEGVATLIVTTKAKNKNGKKLSKKINILVENYDDDRDYEDDTTYEEIKITTPSTTECLLKKVTEDTTEILTECKIEQNIESTTETSAECKIEQNIESTTETSIECKIEQNIESTTEASTECKIEQNIESTTEASIMSETEQKIEDSTKSINEKKLDETTENITDTIKEEKMPTITYQAHVKNKGWLSAVQNGKTAGTTGEGRCLEGLKISLNDDNGNNMIKYCAHVEGTGWQSWKTSGQLAGTTGEGKQMEGIKIELTEKYAKQYDIYYRAHVSNFGWLGWASNGQLAGTEGLALAMEALEIKLVKKNELFDTGKKCAIEKPQYTYQAHVEGTGWQNEVKENMVAGTEGKEKRIEAVKININDEKGISMVEYRAHVQNVGWQNWKNSGEVAGTTGQSKQIEAIQIKLKGDYAKYYDIYYRLHVQDYGWLGWAKNGEMAGTTGCALRAEAMQIKIVYKGRTIDLCGEAYHNTVKNSASTDVQGRINELRSNLVGTYFNVGRNGGCGSKSSGHACSGCLTSNIISQTWFKNLFGNVSTNQFPLTPTSDVCITRAGYSCAGFASFAEWYLYRKNDGDTVNVNKVGTFDFNYTNVNANAKVGDIIRLEYTGGGHGHSAIITGWDQSGLTVLDSNWSSSCNCLVQEHKIYYSSYGWITISRP